MNNSAQFAQLQHATKCCSSVSLSLSLGLSLFLACKLITFVAYVQRALIALGHAPSAAQAAAASLLLCCFVGFYLNATTEQRERRGWELRVHKTIYFGFHPHTHTYSLPQQCGSHSSVKQCAVKIFTRINDMKHCKCVCACVAHIKCINSNFNFNYEYFSSSMSGREGRGRQQHRDLHSFESLARAFQQRTRVLVASCNLQPTILKPCSKWQMAAAANELR